MISYEEAQACIHRNLPSTRVIQRRVAEAAGFALARDVEAQDALPLFASSAMDGYALRSRDVRRANETRPVVLPVSGVAQPGDTALRLSPRSAVRILTGAMLPTGADAVIMQEHVQCNGATLQCAGPVAAGENVRARGEEYREGDRVFARGTLITPAVAGMLATLGYSRVHVRARPRVALVVTGNELRMPEDRLRPGQIRDANSVSLQSALRCMGIEPTMLRAQDDAEEVYALLRTALRRHDCVITSGGISVGDHDYVRGAFARLRVQEHFWRVAIKPGKPVYFGTRGQRMVFGLPGNPVSALLALYLFVRPALARCAGVPVPPSWLQSARLEGDIRKRAGREEFLRVRLESDAGELPRVHPMRGQGSHMLGGLATADALLQLPAGSEGMAHGSIVEVERMQWSLL
ncbi:MAG: molybdopterin molybdotransferase MoeA [Bacteroidota bacterium]|nr:molybdopterin molybdotransferase MoeA [Bacteroidota bacterium]